VLAAKPIVLWTPKTAVAVLALVAAVLAEAPSASAILAAVELMPQQEHTRHGSVLKPSTNWLGRLRLSYFQRVPSLHWWQPCCRGGGAVCVGILAAAVAKLAETPVDKEHNLLLRGRNTA